MKKLLSLLLVLAMLLALMVPAFAEETKTYYLLDEKTGADLEWSAYARDASLSVGFGTTYPMEKVGDNLYKVELPANYAILRFKAGTYYVDSDDFVGSGNLLTVGDCISTPIMGEGGSFKGIWSEYKPAPSLTQPANNTADVTGNFEEMVLADVVYNVGITWGAMVFTYNEGAQGIWNPDTLAYDEVVEAAWEWETAGDNNKITVTNNSNAAVTAALSFTAADGLELTGAFKDAAAAGEGNAISGAFELASAAPAEDEQVGQTQSAIAYFHITDGALDAETMGENESITLGTITVTFEAVANEG